MRFRRRTKDDPGRSGASGGSSRSGASVWKRTLGRIVPSAFRRIDAALLDELEERLIEADFGVAASERFVSAVQAAARRDGVRDQAGVRKILGAQIREVFAGTAATPSAGFDLATAATPPTVYLVAGVNGVGKTTTVGKVAHRLVSGGARVIVAAADTYRAAAVEQLAQWAERAGAEFVAGQAGADPAAVAFDALAAARARRTDVVLVDTAGRLHTHGGLMDQLAKVERVVRRQHEGAPHETLLVLDATVGQNGLVQLREFSKYVTPTGVVLAKMDSTARGGIVVALTEQFKVPVKLVGTGEALGDLEPFDPDEFVQGVLAGP